MVEHESALERDFVLLTTVLGPAAAITSQPVMIHFQAQSAEAPQAAAATWAPLYASDAVARQIASRMIGGPQSQN
ncbi:hypothetical protein [Acidiphilium multivorum]|uniref:hypothetical protein n=1 Tax=Acidiphilium multivorum TaxID=62140 RepID=UPI001B8B68EF|nr:hypothetical protein [Acidiphilium multivorum]MBS3025032.1 hypothetical protein [Acidiphilium multivorum]